MMNEPPLLPLPPFGDATDEALSAVLDGELGAFAQERGLTEESARAQLQAWAGATARLHELEQARGAMQAAAPPLDDLTRRRLVRTAVNARTAEPVAARRSRSWVAMIAVAAAGLLVVIGIGAAISAIGTESSHDTSGSSASGAGANTAPLHGDVGDLGDVTSPEALRALLDRRESATGAEASDEGAQRSEDSRDSALDSGATSGTQAGGKPPAVADTVNPELCAGQLASAGTVAFSGTGTYRGAPVTIIGVTEGARTIVFVVSSTDCSKVLASISR